MAGVEMTMARYGKHHVRLLRVVRGEKFQEVAEYTVTVMLEGDLDQVFKIADNSVVVATDTIKNAVYIKAKTSPNVLQPETFALEIGLHFVSTYPHIHKTYVDIEQQRWARIPMDGTPHPHAFIQEGNEKRLVNVCVDATRSKNSVRAAVSAGIRDLLVMKTTGSAFEGYIKDEYTTLPELSDRVLSTAVNCTYHLTLPDAPLSEERISNLDVPFDSIYNGVRNIALETFVKDDSPSVQATVYRMGERVIKSQDAVSSVTFELPNKHYIQLNLSWFRGLQNTKPEDAEVFYPADFSGVSTATVIRKS